MIRKFIIIIIVECNWSDMRSTTIIIVSTDLVFLHTFAIDCRMDHLRRPMLTRHNINNNNNNNSNNSFNILSPFRFSGFPISLDAFSHSPLMALNNSSFFFWGTSVTFYSIAFKHFFKDKSCCSVVCVCVCVCVCVLSVFNGSKRSVSMKVPMYANVKRWIYVKTNREGENKARETKMNKMVDDIAFETTLYLAFDSKSTHYPSQFHFSLSHLNAIAIKLLFHQFISLLRPREIDLFTFILKDRSYWWMALGWGARTCIP